MTGMEIFGVVNLAVGFLDKYGDSIMSLANRAMGAWEKTAEEQSEILHAIARNQEQLKRTIKQSTEILGTLIKSESLAIIEQTKRIRPTDAIDNLIAGVTTMKEILGETNISKELTERFVTQHLVPVRHYMIKASNILDESEDKNLGRCCRIVGLTALVAGYEYMGQNVDTGLKKELGDELLTLQKYMLTQYVRSILLNGEEFEWEKVPEMLSPKGAKELAQRFIETGDSEPGKKIDNLPDPRGMKVAKALKVIATISDLETLAHFVGLEFVFHNKEVSSFNKREKVLKACREKWDELMKHEEVILPGKAEPDKLPDPRGMGVTKVLKVIATISDLETLARFVGLEYLSDYLTQREEVLGACIEKWNELDV